MLARIQCLLAVFIVLTGLAIAEPRTAHLAPVRTGDRWGYVNQSGTMVILPAYEDAAPFAEGLAAVKVDGCYGYINPLGTVVLPSQYARAENFSDGLALVERNGNALFIDRTGKQIAALERGEKCAPFHQGVAVVRKFEFGTPSTYLLNRNGKRLLVKEKLRDIGDFVGDLAVVKSGGNGLSIKYGYCNLQGKIAIPLVYDEAQPFSGDLAIVRLNGKYGMIDRKGRPVIPPNFHQVALEAGGLVRVRKEIAWGLYTTAGKEIIPPKYDALRLDAGGILVRDGGKWGFLSLTGMPLVPVRYEQLNVLSPARALAESTHGHLGLVNLQTGEELLPASFASISPSTDDLLLAKRADKFGVYDLAGREWAAPQYEELGVLQEGLMPVRVHEQWGYATPQGAIVIPPRFTLARAFSGQVAPVATPAGAGLITQQGAIALPMVCDDISAFQHGIAAINYRGKYGLVNDAGTIVAYPVFDDLVLCTTTPGAIVKYQGKFGLLDHTGTLIVRPIYDDIREIAGFPALLVVCNLNYGLVNMRGTLLLPPTCRDITPGTDGEFAVDASTVTARRIGRIAPDGTMRIAPVYSGITDDPTLPLYRVHVAKFGKPTLFGLLDRNGNVVLPVVYDEIGRFTEITFPEEPTPIPRKKKR